MALTDVIPPEDLQALLDEIEDKVPDQKPSSGKEIKLVCMSNVEPEEVTWLWEPYIPIGKITLLEGDPGCGKTWLALALASIVSNGAPFPDADRGRCIYRRDPGKVLYLSAEDDPADTLRPRLDALGADPSNIYAITGIQDEGRDGVFSFTDLALLDGLMESLNPALVVVDPIQAYLGASVDMHRANETRPVLARLAIFAERHRCAVLCVRHLSKANTSKHIYRGMGSIDFTAAARSVLLAGSDPHDHQKRAIIHLKSSLAPAGPAQGYEMRDGFYWTGISDLTAAVILGSESITDKKSRPELAAEWLQEVLESGPLEKREVEQLAEEEGIRPKTLRLAAKKLGIKWYKKPGEKNGPYIWELPGINYQNGVDQDGQTVELPQGQNKGKPSTRNFPSNGAASTGCPLKNKGQTVETNNCLACSDFDGLPQKCPWGDKALCQPENNHTKYTNNGNTATAPDSLTFDLGDVEIPEGES